MRRPVAGGSPEIVQQEPRGDTSFYVWDYKCPLKSGSAWVPGEKNGDELDFYALDPVRGKGKQLGKAEVERFMDWGRVARRVTPGSDRPGGALRAS